MTDTSRIYFPCVTSVYKTHSGGLVWSARAESGWSSSVIESRMVSYSPSGRNTAALANRPAVIDFKLVYYLIDRVKRDLL